MRLAQRRLRLFYSKTSASTFLNMCQLRMQWHASSYTIIAYGLLVALGLQMIYVIKPCLRRASSALLKEVDEYSRTSRVFGLSERRLV